MEDYILALGRARGTDRPTIYARRLDPHEQLAVKAGVAGQDRAITGIVGKIHAGMILHPRRLVSRFSDMDVRSEFLGHAKNNPRSAWRRGAIYSGLRPARASNCACSERPRRGVCSSLFTPGGIA